jgi:uncharacterized damage-inducible protein DinB
MQTNAAFLEFHHWANMRLLDFCSTLDDAALDMEMPGTFGTIRGTLTHVFATQNEFLGAVAGAPPAALFNGMPFPGFDELCSVAEKTDALFLAAAADREPDEVLKSEWQGQSYEFRLIVPIVQVVNHGIEHRTEIQSILSRLNIAGPRLDGWVWGGLATG